MNNIKTVLLDVDNTILDFNLCSEETIRTIFAENGLVCDEHVLSTFNTINHGLWARIEQQTLTREELHRIRWPLVLDALHIEADGAAFEKRFLELINVSHVPVPGAIELLKYLSGKYELYIASNSEYDRQYERLALAGMVGYVKDIFASAKLGYPKPSREFFDACFAQLPNARKEETVIIGDSVAADIRGGHAYGIKTLWYNHDRIDPAGVTEADVIVDSLHEIMGVL